MVTLATGPAGISRAARLGGALGTGFEKSFVPSFQQTTKDLELQQRFSPIREALQSQIAGGGTSSGQNLIRQITSDPNIFSQVMQNPQMAQTLMTLNRAAGPASGQLTGISGLDEINRTFEEAQKAKERGEDRRSKILFSRVNQLAGIDGELDPNLDLVYLVKAGTDVPIPHQLNPKGAKDGTALQTLAGEPVDFQEGDRLLDSVNVQGGLEGVLGTIEARNLNDAEVATRNFIATAGDALRLLEEEPGANTITGRAAAILGDLKAEATTFADALGLNFDAAQLNPVTYAEQLDDLGVTNARMRSLITSMAFQSAAAAGSRGQSVSNRDIERFIGQVGGDAANPVAFAAVLRDEAQRTARNFRNNFSVRTRKEFEGDLFEGFPGAVSEPLDLGDVTNITSEELLKLLSL